MAPVTECRSDSDRLQSGPGGLDKIETDKFYSGQFPLTPPFCVYSVTSNQTVKPNTRKSDLANMAMPHPRRELCIAMLI